MDMSREPFNSKAKTHIAKGVRKKTDAMSGMVVAAHRPVRSMNSPALTLTFKFTARALLDKFADSTDVEFKIAKQGSDHAISSVE